VRDLVRLHFGIAIAAALIACTPTPPEICKEALKAADPLEDRARDEQTRACVVFGWRLRDLDRSKYDCLAGCWPKATNGRAVEECLETCGIPRGKWEQEGLVISP
jgi:hypothetical protein